MVAGTSTTNRTGASGGGLLLEPVPGGDEPPSLRPRSVHAWGSPFRRSATVSALHAMARSAHRRPALWKAERHAASQKICGEPHRRGLNGFPHHRQASEGVVIMGPLTSAAGRGDQLAGEGDGAAGRQRDGPDRARLAVEHQPDLPAVIANNGALAQSCLDQAMTSAMACGPSISSALVMTSRGRSAATTSAAGDTVGSWYEAFRRIESEYP